MPNGVISIGYSPKSKAKKCTDFFDSFVLNCEKDFLGQTMCFTEIYLLRTKGIGTFSLSLSLECHDNVPHQYLEKICEKVPVA